nr:transposase [Longispora fulva]
MAWIGYKDHQTETCDDDAVNVIVHVLTTPAPEQDVEAVSPIHAALAAGQIMPAEHLLDSGYVTPYIIHQAATEHGITIVGPVRLDPRAADRPRFAKEDFHINWEDQTVTCPKGVTSPPWKPTVTDRKAGISVLFRRGDCRACDVRLQCTGNIDDKGRHLLLLPRPQQEIQTRVRAQQQTPEWQRRYDLRAGAESTVSETTRAHGLRHCRYRGLAKTHVQHVLIAAGTNICRLAAHDPAHPHHRPPSHLKRLCKTLTTTI